MPIVWNKEKTNNLIKLVNEKIETHVIAERLGVTDQQVKNKIYKINSKTIPKNPSKLWSNDEIELLKKLCLREVMTYEIAHLFPLRGIKAITYMRSKLGIKLARKFELSKKGGVTKDIDNGKLSDSNLDEILGCLKFTCKNDKSINVASVLGDRIIGKNGQLFLDGKPTPIQTVIRTTNAILKLRGDKQLGGSGLWV